jgi:surfactin synthase thioesterase subunit
MLKITVFCLPFAGGSKYSYRGYVNAAPRNIEVVPLEIPGRGSRSKEKLLTNIHLILDDVFMQVRDRVSQPYAIYGHSMGTLLAYLLTKRLVTAKMPLPLHLFLSGSGGPAVHHREEVYHLLPKAAFLNKIRNMGGSPDEILDDEILMNFFEPILRADFQATETYQYAPLGPFDIPMTCMIGLQEKTTYEEVLAWKRETTGSFEVMQFPGKHFFIFDHENEILKIIDDKLKTSIPLEKNAAAVAL